MAFVCLLNVGAFAGISASASEGSRDIVVSVHYAAGVPANLISAMREETGALMETGSYRVRWVDTPRDVTAAFLVIVTMEGRCMPDTPPSGSAKTLASAVVEDGRILPFVKINCAATQSFIASVLGSNPQPPSLVGRALGRLLAHELYHVVAQTVDHTSTGVTQAAVSVRELISDQFTFGQHALEKLHHPLESNCKPPQSGLELSGH
jgi:hypothetical protein